MSTYTRTTAGGRFRASGGRIDYPRAIETLKKNEIPPRVSEILPAASPAGMLLCAEGRRPLCVDEGAGGRVVPEHHHLKGEKRGEA